jgi:glycosyltransferase involved in cell wall biosynthesis
LTIFISDYARHVIEQRISIKNAVTIPHGINSSFRTYRAQLARPKIASDEKYILYVSRFDVYKHHYEVVEAYASLPIELRQEYKLLLVGESDGDEANRVIDLIARHGIQGQVRIMGSVPYCALPALYHHAHLVLFASSCENCPNILLEALGAGRPILSSDVMPMPEFGGAGVGYFSPFDPVDIAKKMTEVLINTELTNVMAAAAATRSERFDWAVSAKETWERILEQVK